MGEQPHACTVAAIQAVVRHISLPVRRFPAGVLLWMVIQSETVAGQAGASGPRPGSCRTRDMNSTHHTYQNCLKHISCAACDDLAFVLMLICLCGMHCMLPAGASGYIGSLLVEQLLRTTNVKRIYVLIRGKRGQSAKERLQRILHSGLFHLIRDDAALLQKVRLPEVFAHQCNASQCPACLHIHASCRHV